ncbi:MAG: ksi 2 [Mycobacterium sp.]|jgi:ketosteroid isomerase-like protein|nr:ksi 2 [Mycobacterium sp.]
MNQAQRDTQAEAERPVHVAGRRSREAATAKRKEEWLSLFAEDAVIEDPVGPSAFDPEGKGHRGRDARSAFWDMTIGATDTLEFDFRETFICGDEEANIGSIITTMGGYQTITEGVFTYKVNKEGKIVALRAFWEMNRTAASARRI